ncbi:aminoglycoside phosphotransferase family protein [Legionella nagasakiensis]|uniref:aminoglycoside phosphotransferase family protein n=1 Tax=Legionella nagasakiensis TaxID=535290 RepID=UPI001055DF6B|nr:aminoglycoside phosphotransferase family protein [Legionella nagasakiensis]
MTDEKENNIDIPGDFKERIINTHGEKGSAWLSGLSHVIKYAEQAYKLSNIQPLPHLSFNYTTTARQSDGKTIIVKFCMPGTEADSEIEALNFMRGEGIVKLINYDRNQGILLLEECCPGKTLANVVSESEATRIAANVIINIQKSISDELKFPSTLDWFKRLDIEVKCPSGFNTKHIKKAKRIAGELHNQSKKKVLLHGDLHHFNILSAHRQPWLAIDPKGVVGPPEYECGAFLRNPIPQPCDYAQPEKNYG